MIFNTGTPLVPQLRSRLAALCLVLTATLLTLAPAEATASDLSGGGPSLFALRVGRAETVSGESIPFAVVLVENGKIIAVGQDLPIERGIPIYELPEAVVTPGFINCKSRIGLDSRRSTGLMPQHRAVDEVYPAQEDYSDLVEHGVTTIGLYPAGGGVVGQAVALAPRGSEVAEMVLLDPAYMMMYCGSDRQTKKYLGDAFQLVDSYLTKVEKEREKFDKKNSKKKSKDDDDDKKSKDSGDEFEPPIPDERTLPMLRVLTGEMRALVGIRKAADYLHFLQVIEGRDFEWDLAIDLRNELDLFHIAEQLGEDNVRMVVDPLITTHPGTRRERNLPAELAEAGVRVAFVPRQDSVRGHEVWRDEVARLVRYGLSAEDALRAMTLEPAHVLGLDEQLGSLEVGKRADMIVFSGDPFDSDTKISAVISNGELVHGKL